MKKFDHEYATLSLLNEFDSFQFLHDNRLYFFERFDTATGKYLYSFVTDGFECVKHQTGINFKILANPCF